MTQTNQAVAQGVAFDAGEIRRVLEDLIEAHQRWLVTIGEHRAALSQSDAKSGERCTLAQQQIMGEIAELETRRQDLLQIAALDRSRIAGEPLTVTELARQVGEPERARLLRTGERLRSIIEKTREEQKVLGMAAGALAAHMEGLIRQVATKLQSAATYSPRGASRAPISAGVDIVQ